MTLITAENKLATMECEEAPLDNPSYIARMDRLNHQLFLALERLAIIIHPDPTCGGKCEDAEVSQLGRLGEQIESAVIATNEVIVQIDRIISTLSPTPTAPAEMPSEGGVF